MMKSRSLLILAMLAASANIFGQDTETKPVSRTIFKLSPQHFTINALKAGVERFNKTHTGSISLFLTGMMAKNDDDYYNHSYDGFAGELQFRKYVSPMEVRVSKNNRTFHQGVYGALYLQAGAYTGSFKGETIHYDPFSSTPPDIIPYDYDARISNWGGGFTIGYQKTLWQVIFMEAFIGGGLQFSDSRMSGMVPDDASQHDGISDPLFRGILPKIGLNIGIGL